MNKSRFYMERALAEAAKVKGFTAPNPAIGAVVVRNGNIVATGATSPAGGDHAEVHAIRRAGELCKGAELYVTLEPCSHWGRTPPCSEAVVKAGFRKVIVAMLDPNPQVAGRGIKQMHNAGIEVEIGLMEREAQKLNEDFFYFILNKRPWITVKLAMTLDGRVADAVGMSKWITGPDSRVFVHELRAKHTAIGVGRGTLEDDNPKLNVRGVEGNDPVRIVFSSDKTVGNKSYFRENSNEVRSILVVSQEGETRIETAADGVELWFTGKSDHKESFEQFLIMAGEQEIDSLFIEGGSGLVSTILELQRVNRFYLFYAPKILGGGKDGLHLSNPLGMNSGIELKDSEWKQFGNDMMVTGIPLWGDNE